MANYEANWDDSEADRANIQWIWTSLKEVQSLSQARTCLNSAGLAEEAAKYSGTLCGLGQGYLDTFKSVFSDIYDWIKDENPMI